MLLRRFTIFYRNPRPPICLLSNHHPIIIINNSTNHSSNSCPCSNSIGTSLLHREQQHHRQQFGTTPIAPNSTSPRRAEEKGAEAAEGNEVVAKKDAKVKMVTILARDFIKLDESGDQEQKMFIKLAQDDDSKFFRIGKFPQIFVPEDAYMVMDAMDALLGDLQDKQADQKSDGTPIASHLVRGGKFHDYQLEAVHFGGELCFRMDTVENETSGPANKLRHLQTPIRVLPWLRQRMAEMLVEHDGSQQLGPIPPTPEWILQEAKKQKEDAMLINAQPQEKIKAKKKRDTLLAADDSEITLVTGQTQKLKVKFLCTKTGDKYFIIRRFPSIPLPAAYLVLNGMDALLKDVAEKLNENSTAGDESGAPKRRKKAVKRRGKLPLALQMVECGDNLGDYKLEAIWRKQRLYFQMWADKVEYKNRIFMPIWALPLLRERIAEMMAKHDGSQQIETMPHVPDYVLEKD